MAVAESMASLSETGVTLDEVIASLPSDLVDSFGLMQQSSTVASTAFEVAAESIATDSMQAANDAEHAINNAVASIASATKAAGSDLSSLGSVISSVASAAASAARDAASAAASANSAARAAGRAEDRAAHAANRAATSADKAASADINGSHATGLPSVPFDGYRAELHKGEMIVPANVASWMRGAGVPVQTSVTTTEPTVIDARPIFQSRRTVSGNDDLRRENNELRQELKETNKRLDRIYQAIESGNVQRAKSDREKIDVAKETRDAAHDNNRINDRKQVAGGFR